MIIIAVNPVPRLRSGRHSPDVECSRTQATDEEGDDRGRNQVDPEDRVEEVGDQRTEHDLLGQREVDQPGRAVDQ
jgi:hypothetical protein